MSGGSWDYMYCWDVGKFIERRSDIQAMSKRLLKSGHLDAARAMEEFYLVLDHAYLSINTRATTLNEIMHMVEWVDSADCGEDQLTDVVKKWSGAA